MIMMMLRCIVIGFLLLLLVPPKIPFSVKKKVVFLIDNSESMRIYDSGQIRAFAEKNNLPIMTFGATTSNEQKFTFSEKKSIIDWDTIDRDAAVIIFSDGYVMEKGRRPEIVLPLRSAPSRKSDNLTIEKVELPATIVTGENFPLALTLSNAPDRISRTKCKLTLANNKTVQCALTTEADGRAQYGCSLSFSEPGLQRIVITVSDGLHDQTLTAYCMAREPVNTLLITGDLSAETAFLIKYFNNDPTYSVQTLVNAGSRYLYNGAFTSLQDITVKKSATVIAVGEPIQGIPADIVITPSGTIGRNNAAITDISQEHIPVDRLIITSIKPDVVYHRAGNEPVIFSAKGILYCTVADLYTWYISRNKQYDVLIRRIMELSENTKQRQNIWSLSAPVLYRQESYAIDTLKKTNISLANTGISGEMSENGWQYRFATGDNDEITMIIDGKPYTFTVNTRMEPIFDRQNYQFLDTFSDGTYLSPDTDVNSLASMFRRKVPMNTLLHTAVVLLVLACGIWIREHYR